MKYFIWLCFISISCTSKKYSQVKIKDSIIQENCIYDVCFHNKPMLIDSFIDQTNYNGIMIKVYQVSFGKNELKSFDTLTSKGYKEFPKFDWKEIPYRMKQYMDDKDSGYYKNDESNGDRYLILNYTKHEFILYDIGFLIDLYREDSLKGLLK